MSRFLFTSHTGRYSSIHSRVAITDFRGENIYERYVAPTLQVTDYRTGVTGITEEHLSRYSIFPLRRPVIDLCYAGSAYKFSQVQRQVADIIRNKTIVGHQLWNDLSGETWNSSASCTHFLI